LISVAVALLVKDAPLAGAAENKGFCSRPHLDVGDDPPHFKVRLGLSKTAVAPGQKLVLRVENYGTGSVAYGYTYRLTRKTGSSWREVPVGPFYAARLFAQAGSAGACQEVRVGRKPVPGRYRIEKEVWLAEESSDSSRSPAITFKITSGS